MDAAGTPDSRLWADSLGLDPDRVVAVEAKFARGGRTPMYEGRADPRMQEMFMEDVDGEMRRYRDVILDEHNPVGRLRLVANTEAAATYLGERARGLLGPGVDFQVVVEAAR